MTSSCWRKALDSRSAGGPNFSIDEMANKYRNGGVTVALGRAKVAYVEDYKGRR